MLTWSCWNVNLSTVFEIFLANLAFWCPSFIPHNLWAASLSFLRKSIPSMGMRGYSFSGTQSFAYWQPKVPFTQCLSNLTNAVLSMSPTWPRWPCLTTSRHFSTLVTKLLVSLVNGVCSNIESRCMNLYFLLLIPFAAFFCVQIH